MCLWDQEECNNEEKRLKKFREAQRKVRQGKGPRGIERIDNPKIPYELWHAHQNGEGSPAAVNVNGTPKHGDNSWLTNKIIEFLREHCWNL
jgi:hypothetical protein